MLVLGLLTLAWTVVVWQWQDPFSALYTRWQQHRLSGQLDRRLHDFHAVSPAESPAAVRAALAADAARYAKELGKGAAIGRITIGRLGLHMIFVQGTDHDSLKKGPGHYGASALPGGGRLIYIAGHRTTYLAPFSHIDDLRAGDYVSLQVPYGTFKYVVTRHRIVPASDLAVLRSPPYEVLILQACHPRFFATHRYLVYARPVAVTLPSGRTVQLPRR